MQLPTLSRTYYIGAQLCILRTWFLQMCEEKRVSLTNWIEPCSNRLLKNRMAYWFSPPFWHFFIYFTPSNFNFTLQQTSCVCTWPWTWSQGCRPNISYQKKNLEKKFASSTGDFCILRAPPVWVPCTWVSPAWLRGDARPLYSPLRICSECIVAMQSSWCPKRVEKNKKTVPLLSLCALP